jgi:poly(A) polymerase
VIESPTDLAPTGKIGPQPWMTAAGTRVVVAALTADGAEVRFVGGCVRDAMIRRPVHDIDIGTTDTPEQVMALLERAGIRAIPTGLEHGTVTAIVGDAKFEVTTLRVDVETDGRHAHVAFTDDWIADAQRRDFTINTLSSTPDGDVYDPFGGIDDLAWGWVRFVGVARERIEEDLLRLLRFFRFYATHGRVAPDGDALIACRAMAPRLGELSGERVWGELTRLLLAPDPARVALLMRGERVFEFLLPEAGDIGRLRMLTWLETRAIKMDSVVPDAVRRLAALLDSDAGGAGAVASRLRLSNEQTSRLIALCAPPLEVRSGLTGYALDRALHGHGAETLRDLALLQWAGDLAVDPRQPPETTQAWQDLLNAAQSWTPREFPLKGRDVLALGVPAGREVGALLAEVEEWWTADGCRAGREDCLRQLRDLVEGDD